MANKLVYSWADKLWQRDPPRNYIATRWSAYGTIYKHRLHLLSRSLKQKSDNYALERHLDYGTEN